MALFGFYRHRCACVYFEGLGVLMKEGLVDPEYIKDFMGGDVINYWGRMLHITKGMREIYMPTWGEHEEYTCYDKLKNI